MRRLRLLAVLAVGGIALAACGPQAASPEATKGEIAIGVDLPESGAEASNGIPTLNGVKFAVQQTKTIKGFKLIVENLDDAVNGLHDPQKGAQNISQLIANDKVLGEIGPFNSNVARAQIPIANKAHLTMISPANTNQCLTKPVYLVTALGVPKDVSCKDAGLPSPQDLRKDGPNNYFRVATTDDLQGPGVADYALDVLRVTKVGVASDNEVYGKGIADTFAGRLKKKGGSELARQDFDTKSTNDFRAFLTRAKNAGAQAIFFGGTDSNKACVMRQQMKGIFGADVAFLGGDGIVTGQCIKDAGDNNIGMYGAVAAVDATQNPDAKATIDAFKKAFAKKDDFGAYTMPAYDATKILIAAIGRAIDDAGGKKPTREQVRAQVAKTANYNGTLGLTSFDANGDTSAKIITIYQSKSVLPGVDWVWVKQYNYAAGL